MSSGGRPRDPIWVHYDEVENNEEGCHECSATFSALVKRMKEHWKKMHDNETEREAPTTPKQPKFSSFVVSTTSKKEKEEMDECVGQFFFARRGRIGHIPKRITIGEGVEVWKTLLNF